jgi:hypothetical protein
MAYTTNELIRDVAANISSLILLYGIYRIWGTQGLFVGSASYAIVMVASLIFIAYAMSQGFDPNEDV